MNKLLAAVIFAATLVSFLPTSVQAQTTGLVAAYNFDEGAGTLLVDMSGNKNSGIVSGATWSTQGKYGSALSFNGANSVVSIPDASSLDLTNTLTLEAWVKPTALGGWRSVLLKESPGNLTYALYANTDTNRPSAEIANPVNTDVRGYAQLALNTWTHMAATYDGTTLRYYSNGTLVGSKTVRGTITTSNGALKIGGNTIWGEYFNGLIDDVRIYNTALSQQAIQSDMNTAVASIQDTQPPTVSVSAPLDGATVSGSVTVSANATDNLAVAGVQFKLDNANLQNEVIQAPFAITWDSSTVTNGPHTLSAVARDASGNTATATPITVSVLDNRAQIGQWGQLMDWPLVAVHTTLLPTGKIVLWDAWEYGTTTAKVYDPKTNTFTDASVEDQLFCSAHAMLADGKVLVSGGHNGGETGIKSTYTFDPTTNGWTKKADMHAARWYATNTTLGDGRILALSGQITPNVWNDTPEIFDSNTNSWTALAVSTSSLHDKQYHLPFLLPNGTIYSLAVSQGTTHILNVQNQTWTDSIGIPMRFGSAAMYKPGKILYSGGSNSYSGSQSQPITYVVDMNQQTPSFRQVASMAYPRYQHNLTILPDGSVLAVGGSDILDQQSQTGVRPAEIWDPTTETWTTVASMQDLRMYHSTALLLPDGRVLSAGGGRLNSATNYLTAQIYSPPYLFKGTRPTISSAPQSADYNTDITVQSPQAQDITKVTFIPLASVTHTVDFNQRYLELNFTKNGTNLIVKTPGSGNLAPPGYYMLFAVNSQGIPSEAAITRLGGSQPSPTPTLTPSPSPSPSPSPTPSPSVSPSPTPSGTQQTITFDDKYGQDQLLNGQYPQNIIDWGTNLWWHSAPWGKFTTKSVSFNSPSSTAESFSFVTPRKLVSLQAYNGGGQTTVTLTCPGQPSKQTSIPTDTINTIATGWNQTCTTVSISSTNGWFTNFDNFVVE